VISALLDSNVLIAAVAEAHEHHGDSLRVLSMPRIELAIGAHSYAKAFCTLTRRGDHGPFRFAADEAWAALESIRAVTVLVGLTPAQAFDTTRRYAQSGGVGARVYDKLIGEVAVAHNIATLVTWNISHMRGLFPALATKTPTQFLKLHP
jgi:predicted nucleic acid-binding protein